MIRMLLTHSNQRSVFCFLVGFCAGVAWLLVSGPSALAFQSFEAFSKSKQKKPFLEVATLTDPHRAKPGEAFALHIGVKLSHGWHIYSLGLQDRDETLATKIRFEQNAFQTQARWQEPEPAITLDGALDRVVKVHAGSVRFSRNLTVPDDLPPGTYRISGKIEFRACDNKICSLPREVDFNTRIRILGAQEEVNPKK